MEVTKREIEAARDAVIRHAEIWDRSHAEAVLIFEELIRQIKQDQANKENLH